MNEYTVSNLVQKMRDINKTNSKIISYGTIYSYRFMFQHLNSEAVFKELISQIEYPLPKDYLEFLTITDGVFHINQSILCSLGEVLMYYDEDFHYNRNLIVVATYCADVHICINLTEKDDKYMYITEVMGMKKAYSLGCNFTEFLNRFINCYGTCFWEWGVDYSKYMVIK